MNNEFKLDMHQLLKTKSELLTEAYDRIAVLLTIIRQLEAKLAEPAPPAEQAAPTEPNQE